jgi:branched-chain amino acid transport system permease protein
LQTVDNGEKWRIFVMLQIILQLLMSGIAMGFIYSLVGIEFTLIWNSSSLVNFGHDKFIVLGAYIFGGTFILGMGLNPVLGLIFTLIAMAIFGAIVAARIFNPLRNMFSDIFAVMGTIMLARIITESCRLIWGPTPFTISGFLNGTTHIGNIVLPNPNIYMIIVSILIVIGLQLIFQKTKIGKAMRCIAQNKEASALMGINVPKMIQVSVALSSMICAIIAILIIPIFTVDGNMAGMIGLKGFAAGVVGGFGYLPGSIVGGLFIGILENICVSFMPAVYKDVVAFILLIVFLLIRPQGIMGKKAI